MLAGRGRTAGLCWQPAPSGSVAQEDCQYRCVRRRCCKYLLPPRTSEDPKASTEEQCEYEYRGELPFAHHLNLRALVWLKPEQDIDWQEKQH